MGQHEDLHNDPSQFELEDSALFPDLRSMINHKLFKEQVHRTLPSNIAYIILYAWVLFATNLFEHHPNLITTAGAVIFILGLVRALLVLKDDQFIEHFLFYRNIFIVCTILIATSWSMMTFISIDFRLESTVLAQDMLMMVILQSAIVASEMNVLALLPRLCKSYALIMLLPVIGGLFYINSHLSDALAILLVLGLLYALAVGRRAYQEYMHGINQALELAKARDIAMQAMHSKSAFLANMSHEIRTPMNAVIGMTYLALSDAVDEKQRNYLNNIRNASSSLLGIINDILDFSKIDAGKLDIECIDFHLAETIANTSSIIRPVADKKGLDLVIHYPDNLPALRGDSMRLGQVLINLVNNAVKFTAHGHVNINIEVLQQTETNIELKFSVQDTGIGMTKAQQQKMFQAFSQADSSTTRNYGGTGLGLAICKQLVELMGGEIGLESEPNVGSTFYFQLSFERGDSNTISKAQEQIDISEEALQSLRGAHLLLADDNEINQQVAQGLLNRVGISLRIVDNGLQAVQAVHQEDFDGVLLDMQMPVMGGIEAAEQIRSETQFHDLPIIAMTANAMASDYHACLEAGMNDHISKPVDPDKLYATLMRWIKVSAPQAAESLNSDAPSNTLDFTTIAGIDSDVGLRLVVGNQDLYRKILCKFHASQACATV